MDQTAFHYYLLLPKPKTFPVNTPDPNFTEKYLALSDSVRLALDKKLEYSLLEWIEGIEDRVPSNQEIQRYGSHLVLDHVLDSGERPRFFVWRNKYVALYIFDVNSEPGSVSLIFKVLAPDEIPPAVQRYLAKTKNA